MNRLLRAWPWLMVALLACVGVVHAAHGAESLLAVPGIKIRLAGHGNAEMSSAIRILIGLTILSLAPAILICLTSFVRIVVVLSMLRHSLGMPETPPNIVIISLSLFLTFFTMAPVFNEINTNQLQPFLDGKLSAKIALEDGSKPLREFMVRQTREQDLALLVDISRSEPPKSIDDIGFAQLIPAFMLSELRTAFQIGFAIFLPFLLIDLIVASSLMSLGMMMMPPTTVAMPLKILMFVLIDGWNLVVRALLGTFS